jgi:hypothetical protein
MSALSYGCGITFIDDITIPIVTTRTKLNITVYITCIMMLLNVFSKPLHIPEPFQWALIIGVFVPIGLTFYFIKVQKREKAEASGTGKTVGNSAAANPATEQQKKTKQHLLLGMGSGCVIGLCAPLWLPLTGTTLGPKGNFVVGLITVAICYPIFSLRLRKL